MADTFVYRADPPARLAASEDLSALARMQQEAGLDVVTPGSPVTEDELRRSPHDAIARLSAELGAVRSAVPAPVKLALPLPGLLGLDPMLLQGLMGNLIDEGTRILQLHAAAYADPDRDPSDDGFVLSGLPRPEGFRLAVDLGALADWSADRLAVVTAELGADRHVLAIGPDDDLSRLSALPGDSMAVLGLIDPAGGEETDAILTRIDAAAAVLDEDRLALTVRGGLDGQAADTQARVLRQLADVAVRFWGFAM
ncbi:hypothetical protein ruthe_03110 [Rubellimicrobium thermophilum DSM 16684]|uniref:Uncharacterized protein n=1 Tax=Rubellimicrobium thermophilum DSM 16684 TaxID=1123069 RepID=S9RXX1_9RHOB|nr:hypothetical protein [Rubellimicrobium thermophilum]EPX82885.1 hypothetical protein ruthe_03110 [Rubellimicrobium thermophilum DSM 16684]